MKLGLMAAVAAVANKITGQTDGAERKFLEASDFALAVTRTAKATFGQAISSDGSFCRERALRSPALQRQLVDAAKAKRERRKQKRAADAKAQGAV